MNCINLILTSENELESKLDNLQLAPDKPYFIRIHTCIHTKNTVMPFVERLKGFFPNAKIYGSSTSGVICEGKLMSDCCMISFTEFRKASAEIRLLPLTTEDGVSIGGTRLAEMTAKTAIKPNTKFAIALFGHSFAKISSFVDRMNALCPNVQLIGGIANEPAPNVISVMGTSFVFDGNTVAYDSLAVAVINAEELNVYSNFIYVTEPVGHVHTITDADGMIIRAIDGENAVDWYQKQLGISLDGQSALDTTVLFPLVRSDHGDMPWALSYSPQNDELRVFPDEPDPVMFVPSEAKTGERVRLSYSSIRKTVDLCEDVCNELNEQPAEVLFGYTCVSRQNLFSNCIKWELMPFERTNLSGALVAGEIGSRDSVNCYCNYSFTIAALSESSSRMKINTDALRRNAGELVNRQEHIVKYLQSTKDGENADLTQRQNEIAEILFTDEETGIANTTKYSYDFGMGKFDKICMLTFRNEGLLNAFMSKSKFNTCFIKFAKSVVELIDNDSFGCYVYKKMGLILTSSPQVCDAEFVDVMHTVQNFASEYKFGNYVPVTEFSVVMHEEDMINKAELTLMSMRKKNIFFLHYTSDLGLEQIHAKRLKMLKVLNEAVTSDRVIPYYQGIYDNRAGCINMYESLMRITDEEGVVYSPAAFMEIAKEYGFYPDISYLMISKVMSTFRTRKERVTINLNISDIYNYKIVHFIRKFLKNAPHPENYIFELTETEEIEDYSIISEFVDQIHNLGAKIAIDDFGSGFSNIVNIFKVPSDYIKIDGEIVRNIKNDIYAREFLEMIAAWAEKHGKEIVAEFIENQDIQTIINDNSIRYSQGYLFSKPSSQLIEIRSQS